MHFINTSSTTAVYIIKLGEYDKTFFLYSLRRPVLTVTPRSNSSSKSRA